MFVFYGTQIYVLIIIIIVIIIIIIIVTIYREGIPPVK